MRDHYDRLGAVLFVLALTYQGGLTPQVAAELIAALIAPWIIR